MALPTVGAVFGVFCIFCQNICNSFFYVEKMFGSECLGLSSQTYSFNSNYNIDPSTMVIRHFKNMRFFC